MTSSYFDKIQDVLLRQIALSQYNILIAVAWFTNESFFEALKDVLNNKVKVKIVILSDLINRNEFGLDFGILTKQGAEIRFAKSDLGTMHNKFCIIDDLVITGSYNWTYHANKNNENILMTDEESVVNNYKMEFERLFDVATPIPKPYEHLKWTDVKEGDFSELRRNIFRDIIAKNDENRELKRIKLINLDHAFKSGDAGELAQASSLATEQHLRSITDVLISRSQDFTFKLWEENIVGKPFDNVDGHDYIGKWWFIPYCLKEDKYHRDFIEGTLIPNASRNCPAAKGLNLNIYDEDFIIAIKKILCSKTLSITTRKYIPDSMLRIDLAKMFYNQFPSPMFNKSQPRTWKNTMPRTISAINLLGIVKEVNGDNVVFYEGWDPQKRGEKIVREFFSTPLIEHENKTITDVLTSTQIRYVRELFYETSWDSDEEPADVRYSTIDKWIFIPTEFGESRNHEKYVRGYLHFYKWYKSRKFTYMKIKIDIFDGSFISCIERYLQGSMDISKIPEDVLCINLAKLSIIRLPKPLKVRDKNALAVLCLVKEVSGNNIIYYEGWDPQQREQEIIKKLRQG